MRQEEKETSGNLTDDELRSNLARAVAAAERVIGGTSLPLPFDEPVEVSDSSDITDGSDVITPDTDLPM